jgi:hypothetical protein
VIAERHLIELWRVVRKKSGEDLSNQATDRVVLVRIPNTEEVPTATDQHPVRLAMTFVLSGKNMTPNWQTTPSKLASGERQGGGIGGLERDRFARLELLACDFKHWRWEDEEWI